jgi:hypothetical protein
MIKIIDTLEGNKPLSTIFKDEEDFITNSFFKQKEKFALLGTLDSNKPVNHLAEIFGLRLELLE